MCNYNAKIDRNIKLKNKNFGDITKNIFGMSPKEKHRFSLLALILSLKSPDGTDVASIVYLVAGVVLIAIVETLIPRVIMIVLRRRPEKS